MSNTTCPVCESKLTYVNEELATTNPIDHITDIHYYECSCCDYITNVLEDEEDYDN